MDYIYQHLIGLGWFLSLAQSGIGIGVCVLLMVFLLLREGVPQHLQEALMWRENYVYNSYRGTDWNFYACFCNGKGALSYWGKLAGIAGAFVGGFMIYTLLENVLFRIIFMGYLCLAIVIQLIISTTLYCKVGKRYQKSPLFIIGMCIWPYSFLKRIVEEDTSGTDEEGK